MSDTEPYFRCYICNISDLPGREGTKIFREEEVLDSGLRLSVAVEQILGHSIDPSTDATICTKCYDTCEEYDEINKRLMKIKSKLRQTSENSSLNRALIVKDENSSRGAVDSQEQGTLQVNTSHKTTPEKNASAKIIVSASKLKPVPGDFFLGNATTSAVSKPHQPTPVPVKLLMNMKASTSEARTASLLIRNQQHKKTQASPSEVIQKHEVLNRTPLSKNARRFDRKRVTRTPTLRTVKTGHATEKGCLIIDQTSDPEPDKFIISEVEVLGSEHVQDGQAETILLDENGQVIEMIEGGNDVLSNVSEIKLVLSKNEARSDNEPHVENENNPKYTFINTGSDAEKIVSLKDNIYTCLVCKNGEAEDTPAEDYTFEKASLILVHMKKAHHLRIYICTVCGSCYHQRANYVQCVRSHRDSNCVKMSKSQSEAESAKTAISAVYRRRYICDTCDKSFASKTLLEQHINVHTGSRPFKCKQCGKSYTNKYILHSHLKTHTDRPRPFKCKDCGKSFLSPSNLTAHERIHNPFKPNFLCRECGKTFMSAHSLDTHAVVHSDERPFVCGVCEKAFARRAEIRDHLRTHTGEKPYACDMCGARFAQSSNMNSHKRAVHFDERRYECAQCPKKFRRKRLLTYHEQSAHTGERPHKCQVCGATFVYPEHLKKHMRAIHDPNSKTFACEVCNKKFNSSDNRNAHRYTHSDKKPYECFVCGAGFMRKPQLYAHMSNEGHLADMIVVNQAQLALHGKDKELEKGASVLADPADNNYIQVVVEEPVGADAADIPVVEQNEDAVGADIEQFLVDDAEVLTADEDGNVMRLVQVRLQDGRLAWATVGTT